MVATHTNDFWRHVYGPADNLLCRRVADCVILVPVQGKLANMRRVFSLNPVAEIVWRSLDGNTDLERVLCAVMETFDVAEDRARCDVAEFVGLLRDAGLVVRVG